jgi:hypothetical protein
MRRWLVLLALVWAAPAMGLGRDPYHDNPIEVEAFRGG